MAVDTEIQRKLTQAFIDDNPIELEFIRRPLISDGQGGYELGSPTTLPPQEVRLVSSALISSTGRLQSPEANLVSLEYVLVALIDLDIEVGDTFVYNNDTHKVTSVKNIQDWSIEAGVTSLG